MPEFCLNSKDMVLFAETHHGFLQEKRIFTGAHHGLVARSVRRVGNRNRTMLCPKRIDGDVSTISQKEREYCHQQ